MTEWIVLTWIGICPFRLNSLPADMVCEGDGVPRHFISSSTAAFNEKWNSLSGKERETARIFSGKELQVKTILELQDTKEKSFEQILDETELGLIRKLNLCLNEPHVPDHTAIIAGSLRLSEMNTEFSRCKKCGRKIKKKVTDGLWKLYE